MKPAIPARSAHGPRSGAFALLAGAAAFLGLPASAGGPTATPPGAPQGDPASTSPKVRDQEVALLAGGCFWGMQDLLRKIPGVLETEAGYTGGWLANPRYDDTHHSASGHAESVRVVFDPKVLSYADLLEKWFFRMHDPTTPTARATTPAPSTAAPSSTAARRSATRPRR